MWAALGVLTAINVFTWLRYFQPAPFTDMVDLEWFLTNWSLARDGVAPLITYPDNEHRAFLPVLLQAFDHKALGSTGRRASPVTPRLASAPARVSPMRRRGR